MHCQAKASFSIALSEGIKATLLATCQSIKNDEKKSLNSVLVYFSLEEEDNNIFLSQIFSNESSDKFSALSDNNTESNDKKNWKDIRDVIRAPKTLNNSLWIDFGAIINRKKKLI